MGKKTGSGGIKSALELALERTQQQPGSSVPLTPEQKAALAEIEAETRARVAEEEIMAQERIRTAFAGGDADAARQADEAIKAEIARIRERGERRKEKIRKGEPGA